MLEIGFKTPLTRTVVLAGTVRSALALLLFGRAVPEPNPKAVACVDANIELAAALVGGVDERLS
jgi:hypothetical protein